MYMSKIKSIKSIYDGDTLIAVLDLGFGVFKEEKLRLAFIDTPEIRGDERPEGIIARDWLRNLLYTAMADGVPILVKTYRYRKGKYGRYIAELFINDLSINMQMLEEGIAEVYE